jgi:hypothetical protein
LDGACGKAEIDGTEIFPAEPKVIHRNRRRDAKDGDDDEISHGAKRPEPPLVAPDQFIETPRKQQQWLVDYAVATPEQRVPRG